MRPHDGSPLEASLGPGAEFDVVRRLAALWGDAARGLGDDCATFTVPAGEQLVTSTDTSVEDVHFREGWLTPREIGWRAATAGASDLAAAGASPLGLLLALTVPHAWRDSLDEVALGVGEVARALDLPVLGGDLTRGAAFSVGVTVFGSARNPIRRSGAASGGVLCITGALGGPGRALAAWLAGGEPSPADRARFARPDARIAAGRWLAEHGTLAAIDISDGLAADVAHLAHASGLRITIELARLPTVSGADPRAALASGEEYELAVVLPADADIAALGDALWRAHGVRLTQVGDASPGPSEVVVLDGTSRVDLPRGHDHFAT